MKNAAMKKRGNLFLRSLCPQTISMAKPLWTGRVGAAVCVVFLFLCPAGAQTPKPPKPPKAMTMLKQPLKPLFRDFMGLNGHSVSFKPALYKPVGRLVRDYHPLDWDLDDDTSVLPPFPLSKNGVNWDTEYGSWQKSGDEIDASIQVESIPEAKWKALPQDALAYGQAFARFFGPSGTHPLVSSVEIGNEPGSYSESAYRTVFENMARGFRQGDPKLKIATCSVVMGKADQYSKSISCLAGLQSLYDIINLHTYAFAEQYPTWRRSYPEDPSIAYLTPIKEAISWRDANAPGKAVWVTEFGWDATTKPDEATGDFSRWVGSTETQQAQYLVRSFLVFSAMDVGRAYLYYYDDSDQPRLHSASGLTRNSFPKPAFYAVAHLYRTLGDYRFTRAIAQKPGDVYAYEYESAASKKDRIWAVWSPTGSNRQVEILLPAPHGTIDRAEIMPLTAGPAEKAKWTAMKDGKIKVTVGESPVYFWIHAKSARVKSGQAAK
jgi:hypothetical protein